MSLPADHGRRRELCKDCGAVDGDGRPTVCQQGCPSSYLTTLPARLRRKKRCLIRRHTTLPAVDVRLVLENMDWIMSLPKGTITVEIEAGNPLCSVKIMGRGISTEAMRRFGAPGFRS